MILTTEEKRELYRIKQNIMQAFPQLINRDFRIWQYENKVRLQACIIRGNGEIEFYGHIYQVENMKESKLKIII